MAFEKNWFLWTIFGWSVILIEWVSLDYSSAIFFWSISTLRLSMVMHSMNGSEIVMMTVMRIRYGIWILNILAKQSEEDERARRNHFLASERRLYQRCRGVSCISWIRHPIRSEFYSPIDCPSPRSNSAILASVVPQTDRIRSCDLFHYCCSVFSRVHNNAAGSFPRSAYLSVYAWACSQRATRISP